MGRQNHAVERVPDLGEVSRDVLSLGLDVAILAEVLDVTNNVKGRVRLDVLNVGGLQ